MVAKSGPSLIYRTHPYVRVYCALLVVITVALAPKPTTVAACALIALAACFAARLPVRKLLWGLVPLISMVAGLYFLGLLAGNNPNVESLHKSGLFLMRCWTEFAVFAALRTSIGWACFVKAVEFLRLPVLLTLVTGSILRWVDTLREEATNVNNARLLRGGNRRPIYRRSVDIGLISASLMIRSLVRAEDVANAMELRGFDGRLTRSLPMSIAPSDFCPLCLMAIILALLWWVP
jgi:energy-coupling factor transporter transmembrane protein EcfT